MKIIKSQFNTFEKEIKNNKFKSIFILEKNN